MIPAKTLLKLLAAWLLWAVVLLVLRLLDPADLNFFDDLWWWAGALLTAVAVSDALHRRSLPLLQVSRELPHSLGLGAAAQVHLILKNNYSFALSLQLTEMLPAGIESASLPISIELAAGAETRLSYSVTPSRRGDARFGPTCLRIMSRWRLWERREWRGEPQHLKVYPNFAPIARLAMMGLEHQLAQLGAHLQPRRGAGSDFHQLREFRAGDSLRQIDWKATARHRKPISRDYQDERDQEVVFVLDCGRRLRAHDGALTHFDHALNALLLTAYVALRNGDAVALLSFAGQSRWQPAVKGQASINTLLNRVYDLECGTGASDYLEAAQKLLAHQRKRALVIFVTHLQQEDTDDIIAATRLLEHRHVVMVANLRDGAIDAVQRQPVRDLGSALTYCGIGEYLDNRRRLLHVLENRGAIVVDALPHALHSALLSEYLRVKRSGRL